MTTSPGSAADILYGNEHGGQWPDQVPEPPDLTEGLRVQLDVLERHLGAGDHLRGWKVALTAGTGRDLMGPGFRPFGYLLDSRTLPSGVDIQRSTLGIARVEAELCLVIGQPLAGDQVTRAQARAAVRGIAPSFEVNEIRFPGGASHPVMIADNLGGWGAVVGDEIPVPSGDLTATRVDVWQDGHSVTSPAPDLQLEDPFLSLVRLVHLLHRHGRSLHPGDLVITGALWYADVPEAATTYHARFAEIGEVEVTFS